MQNQVYERCRKLFREAKSLTPAEWPAFVQDRCHDNPELASRLTRLLDAHRDPDPLSPLNIDHCRDSVPRGIVNWEIIDEIGKGGAGTVYRARRVGAPQGGI